jgi:uncharacterized protein (TIGR00730 family)
MTKRPANRAQMQSPSYILPVEDTAFLLRDEMRSTRFALEYAKAELLLRDWGVRSTVVVFGGARVPSPEAAQRMLKGARGTAARIAAQRQVALSHWYEEARRFGRIVSERCGALATKDGVRDNVIATGGGPGIMEAANRGAREAGAPTIGFNITLPQEQEPNAYSTPELTFRFHYFAMRKMHLAMRAAALAVFPGGFGTLDELFEILTLQQTHKAPPMPVVLVGTAYWKTLINFEFMIESGLLSEDHLDLFDIVDDAEAAWSSLVCRGLLLHTAS